MAFERTFAMIKPDAVANRNVGKILALIEENGFHVVGMKIRRIGRVEADAFYAVHRERPFFKGLVDFMTEGPVVVMVLQREDAIAKWRELMLQAGSADSATVLLTGTREWPWQISKQLMRYLWSCRCLAICAWLLGHAHRRGK